MSLRAGSEYFRALFLGDFSVSRHDIAGIWVAFFQECQQHHCGQEAEARAQQPAEVQLEGVEPRTVRDLLWCLFTGDSPDPADGAGLVELLAAAHRFGCEVVQIQCEALLAEGIDTDQVCDVMLLAEHYGRPQLLAMATAFAAEHREEVERTEGWARLPPALAEAVGAPQQ